MAHPESSPSHGATSRSNKGAQGGSAVSDDEKRDVSRDTVDRDTVDRDTVDRDTVELGVAELSRLRELDPADEDEDRETVEITEPLPFSSEGMSSSPFSAPALSRRGLVRGENAADEDAEESAADEERVAWHTIPAPAPSGAEED